MHRTFTLIFCLFLSACTARVEPKTTAPKPAPKTETAGPVEEKKETPTSKPDAEKPLVRPTEEKTRTSLIPANASRVRVRRVVDGDTVELEDGKSVRYLCIDTPERKGKDGNPEPFYKEAADFNRKMVEGKEIFLEFDVEKKDKYDRLLAYIWVRDGDDEKMVNAEILRSGLAYVYTPAVNVKYAELFVKCQREARENGRGFWKDYKIGGEAYFVGTKNGHAFHRPGCDSIKNSTTLIKYKDQSEALDAGRSPCRNCKP